MTPNVSPRSWRLVAPFLVACILLAPGVAQNPVASIDLLGMGCGNPQIALNATVPLYTMPWTVFMSNAPPNSFILLGITMPPDLPLTPLGPSCFLWITPNGTPGHPPFFFSGVTSPTGTFSLTFPPEALAPFPPGAVCNAQAFVCTSPTYPGAVQFAAPFDSCFGFSSNGIAATMGDPPPNTNPGVPNPLRTYLKSEFGGNGPGGQLLIGLFQFAFPLGLEIGDYNTSTGSCPPNGKLWTSTGITQLRTYLMQGGGMSGSFDMDALNTSTDCGGGPLGRGTAALALNVGFSNLGLLGGTPGQFGDLILIEPSSSLHMQSIEQILAVAQSALASGILPAGYSFVSLQGLVDMLNMSFHNMMPSMWAAMHLMPQAPMGP